MDTWYFCRCICMDGLGKEVLYGDDGCPMQGCLYVRLPCCLALVLKLETTEGVIVNINTSPLFLLVREA